MISKQVLVEDGFDQVRRSSCALTEFAVAIGDPQGLGTGCVPDSPAKASALIKLHFKLHLADHSPTLPGSSNPNMPVVAD